MKAIRNWSACLTGVLLLTTVGTSSATDDIVCTGRVATIGIHSTDRVMLRLTGMNTVVQICHLAQTMGTTYPITPAQCKLAYATLVTAHTMGKQLSVYFDNVQSGTSCSTFVAWEVATARWVHLTD